MFGFRKKKPVPPLCPSNPGIGVEAKVAFSTGNRSWTEEVNLVRLAAEEHPFCPCCLLTRSFEAFRGFMEGDGFYCLRLFAARDTEGVPQADCRVNGED